MNKHREDVQKESLYKNDKPSTCFLSTIHSIYFSTWFKENKATQLSVGIHRIWLFFKNSILFDECLILTDSLMQKIWTIIFGNEIGSTFSYIFVMANSRLVSSIWLITHLFYDILNIFIMHTNRKIIPTFTGQYLNR